MHGQQYSVEELLQRLNAVYNVYPVMKGRSHGNCTCGGPFNSGRAIAEASALARYVLA